MDASPAALSKTVLPVVDASLLSLSIEARPPQAATTGTLAASTDKAKPMLDTLQVYDPSRSKHKDRGVDSRAGLERCNYIPS